MSRLCAHAACRHATAERPDALCLPVLPPTAARDDVAVITANPKTAGVARWIFFALWGVKLKKGKQAANDYVTKVGGLVVLCHKGG